MEQPDARPPGERDDAGKFRNKFQRAFGAKVIAPSAGDGEWKYWNITLGQWRFLGWRPSWFLGGLRGLSGERGRRQQKSWKRGEQIAAELVCGFHHLIPNLILQYYMCVRKQIGV